MIAAASYELNGNPTLAPIAYEYQIESFSSYLAIEQDFYPVDRQNISDVDALTCMSTRLVDILPGVMLEDIFWNTEATHKTEGIWNSEETTYFQFEINFVPAAIVFAGLPNAEKTYDGATYNPHIVDPHKADPNINNGWNGVYQLDVNCRDCFPSSDVVYLHFKDLIAQDITSGKFVSALKASTSSTCQSYFAASSYAYVSFSESAAVTVGEIPPRPVHNLHLRYLWFLMFLLVPAAIVLYNRAYAADAGTMWLSKYEQDRETEMATTVDPAPVEGAEEEA